MLKPGYIANIVLVDGDPLKNLALLTDPAKVQLVMKDGAIHKDCSTPVPSEAALHLPGRRSPAAGRRRQGSAREPGELRRWATVLRHGRITVHRQLTAKAFTRPSTAVFKADTIAMPTRCR
jgi:hypothetical protein